MEGSPQDLLSRSLLIFYQTSYSLPPHSLSLAMRSFVLSAFASLAFCLFCSAAPAPLLGAVITVVQKISNGTLILRDVNVPTENAKSLESVLSDVVTAISPIVEKISGNLFVHISFCCLLLT